MLSKLDPTYTAGESPSSPDLIPTYTQPRVYHALLPGLGGQMSELYDKIMSLFFSPGNLHYLHVEKPSLRQPLQQAMARADYVRICMESNMHIR